MEKQGIRWAVAVAGLLLGACSSDGTSSPSTGGEVGGQGQGANTSQGGTSSAGGSGGNVPTGSSGKGGSKPVDPCADCAGCCDGTTCLPLASQSDLSCGRGGAKCDSCVKGKTCKAGLCVVDNTTCTPLSCGGGCCLANECNKTLAWDACSAGGTDCLTCDPMALCTKPGSCDNSQWDPNAMIDLYVEEFSVSEAQCSDPIGKPDPKLTFTIGGQTFSSGTCADAYSCGFDTPWKIQNIPLSLFLSDGVKLSVVDVDETVDDPCWSGAVPVSGRDFSTRIFKPGDGSLTYHLRPAGY